MTRSVVVVLLLTVLVVLGAGIAYQRVFDERVASTPDVDPPRPKPPPPPPPPHDFEVPLPPAIPNAVLKAVHGTVQVRRGNDEKGWVDAAIGSVLAVEDSLQTKRGAEATLSIGDGVEMRLSSRSELNVRELTPTGARVRLDRGQASGKVVDGKVLMVQSRTGDAQAESHGGTFGVVTDGDGGLGVATTTGTVKLTTTTTHESVDVTAGQESRVAAGAPPTVPVEVATSLFLKMVPLATNQTNQTSATLRGTTTPGAVARVGDKTTTANERGQFAMQVSLAYGRNDLEIEVQDPSGRREVRREVIISDPKKPDIKPGPVRWGAGVDPGGPAPDATRKN